MDLHGNHLHVSALQVLMKGVLVRRDHYALRVVVELVARRRVDMLLRTAIIRFELHLRLSRKE